MGKESIKIIIINYLPLTASIESSVYIRQFIADGYQVEYWDISRIFFNIDLVDTLDETWIRKIDKYSQMKKALKDNLELKCLYIPMMTLDFKTMKFYQIISRYKCLTAGFDRPGFPLSGGVKKTVGEKIKLLFSLKTYQHLVSRLVLRLFKKIGLLKNPDYIFKAGTDVGFEGNSHCLSINHFDFDNVLENTQDITLPGEKYCVFLDEYLPYHPDFALLGIKTVNPETYFMQMNDFFDSIEKKMGYKVKIALHPKSDYKENPYGGREILRSSTRDLVRHSELVIAHASTSISFGVIFNKPIIFKYTPEIERVHKNGVFYLSSLMAESLGAPFINSIDELDRFDSETGIMNLTKFKEYRNRYLVNSKDINMTSYQLISAFLVKVFL